MKKFILFMMLICSVSYSQSENIKARFLIAGALDFGGDDVGYVYFTDGTTQSINSGQGVAISIGGELDFLKTKGLFLRGTIGYKYVTTKAENAHIRLTRIPLELTANYNIVKRFWAGLGLTSHTGIKLNFDGLAQNEKFTSSLGTILKIGYGGLGISYTIMKYEGSYNDVYNANSFGLIFALPIKDKSWK